MTSTEDLENLAELCLESAKTLKSYLNKSGQPQPTFNEDGPIFFPQLDQEAEIARLTLRHASKTLNDLATGPDFVGQHAWDILQDLAAFRYVFYYKIPYAVPHGNAVSYKEVADKTGTNEKEMRKFVRQLIQIHVFCEPKPGFVAHTAASKALKHPGLQAFNAYHCNDNLPLVAKQVEAFEKWGHGSQEVNQTPAQIVYDTEKGIYEAYLERPDLSSRFNDLMVFVSSHEHFSNAHVATGFDWNLIKDGTVVDIGGNMGHCCIDIARANPEIRCIVQELPEIVTLAIDPSQSVIPKDLQNRISFMSHDFYNTNPVRAEAYLLRMILHNYPDKICIKILRALVPALRPGSRIIVMDQVMPPVGVIPPVFERVARTMQLQMQLMCNGVERELEEWEELFEAADPRLKLKNIVKPEGSLMSVIEVVFEEKK